MPKREFMYSKDMADACIYLMNLSKDKFTNLLGSDESKTGNFDPPLVNIGVGEDLSIKELAEIIMEVVGYSGKIVFDTTKHDGAPRKLMDVSLLNRLGWQASTTLRNGLTETYNDFLALSTR
jgi:GDP-L-fucose synthase